MIGLQEPQNRLNAIDQWMRALEHRYPDVFEHSVRAGAVMLATLEQMQVSEAERVIGAAAAYLHDVGKVFIPEAVVQKVAAHDADERHAMRLHVSIGAELLMPYDEEIANIVAVHHERIDGRGYPRGRKADDLTWLQRLLPVVDSFVAMTEDRPYQRRRSSIAAAQEIRAHAGAQFDRSWATYFTALDLPMIDLAALDNLARTLAEAGLSIDLRAWVARTPGVLQRLGRLACAEG